MTKDNEDEGGKRPFVKRPFDRNARSGDEPRGRPAPTGGFGNRDRDDKPRGERRAPRSEDEAVPDEGERIAKRLARAGIASRRDAETMIAAGRIAVNGKVLTSPAINVKRTDIITFDKKPLPQIERTRLWLYHKPAGLVTTNRDPEGRTTVFETLPADMPRVLSVGRLDINTEGLLLLTNDGGLSRILELPSTGWLRRYRVRAHGTVTQAQLDELKNGIAVDGVFYGSVEAQLEREQGANVWLSVGLREGKNREVKNILGALGLTVSRLIRISFGPFQLSDLEEGAVREIRGRILRDQLGEKLIEESGADFDGPIINEFSNSAVRGSGVREVVEDERPARRPREWISSTPEARSKGPRRDKGDRPDREDRGDRPRGDRPTGDRPAGDRPSGDKPWGARPGGDKPRFDGPRGDRPDRAPRADKASYGDKGDRRASDLSRLTTSPRPAGGKSKPERGELPARRPRGVNVWMAPGARPQTSKHDTARPSRDDAAGERPSRGRSNDRPDGDRRPRDDQRSGNRPDQRDGEARAPRGPRPSGDFQSRPRRNDDARPARPEGAGRPFEKRGVREDRPVRDDAERRPRREDEVKRPGKRERQEARDGDSGSHRPAAKPARDGERRFEDRGAGPRSENPRSGPRNGSKFDGPNKGPRNGPGAGSGPRSAPRSGPSSGPSDGPRRGPGGGSSGGSGGGSGQGAGKRPGGGGADRRR